MIKCEGVALPNIPGRTGDSLVLRLHDGSAFATDQKLPDMRVIRVITGNEGSRAIQPMHQAHLDQEIEAAVDARRRYGRIVRLYKVEEVVCGCWPSSLQKLC